MPRRWFRFWDFLTDSWPVRFARLGLGRHRRRQPVAASAAPRQRLAALPLEDRVVPARPLPLPFIFAGAGTSAPPVVKAYFAETGTLAFQKTPFDPAFAGGVRVAAGDLNHDGWPELIAAAGPGGGPHVKAYDGKTGELISGPLGSFFAYDSGFLGGVSVASGDCDGDGHADLITAAGAGGAPHVKVFSGKTGGLLKSSFAFAPEFRGGATVMAADFTGDGLVDLAVGAGAGGGPHVKVFDLQTQDVIPGPLGSFFAFDPAFTGGVDPGTDFLTGDVTGDKRADLVVGRGPGAGSLVRVYDGVSGSQVGEFSPFGAGMTAGVRTATAFVNDDEYADVVCGTGAGPTAAIRVFDGKTLAELPAPMSGYTPFGGGYTGGVYVAASNDPDTVTDTLTMSPTSGLMTGMRFDLDWVMTDGNPFNGYQVPTGVAMFTATDGTTKYPLGSATLKATGTAGQARAVLAVNPLPLPAGVYTVTADYPGDSWFLSTSSAYPPLTVTAPTLGSPGFRDQPYAGGCASGACPLPGLVAGAGDGGGRIPQFLNRGGRIPQFYSGVRDDGGTSVVLYGGPAGRPNWSGNPMIRSGVSWTNATGYQDVNVKAGAGAVACGAPVLTQQAGGQVAMVDGAGSALWFAGSGGGGGSAAKHGFPATLTTGGTNELVVADGAGGASTFYDFGTGVPAGRTGRLKSHTSADGVVTTVVSWDGSGRPTEVQSTDPVSGAVESVVTAYTAGGEVDTLTRRRKPSGGSFSTVRTTEFGYATVSGVTDRVLVSTTEKDAGGNIVEETYNRWYASGASTGYAGGLKYHLGPQATARLKQAYSGTALSALSDSQVAAYADQAYEYDPTTKRVTKAVAAGAGCSACFGGQGTATVIYGQNASPGSGVNDWAEKVATTLDDGTVRVVYANAQGQPLLTLTTSPGVDLPTWAEYTRYDSAGRVILTASAAAVSGYDESLADLVGYSGGTATHLRNADGLVSEFTYATSTTATTSTAGDVSGYLKSVAVRKGESGTAVPQADTTYIARTAGGTTMYHVATDTRYRNDNGTGGQTTSFAYTWQGSTHQPASVTTTLPTVTTAQNGPNTAATSTVVYDASGRPIWTKDAAGVLGYAAYDAQTGAVVKAIADVNTANTGDFANLPSGWSTPGGAGQHLISTYEVDGLGRTTKATDPLGRVTYTVFNDLTQEVRVYAGWNTSTSAPTGPTLVYRDDRANNYTETLTMSATPTVSGGRPTGTESVSSIQSLTRTYRNAAGQAVTSDTYFDLTGVTYSTAANIGTLNTHYHRVTQDYSKQGLPNRSVSAAGTITRTEYDSLGRASSVWVGTDDTPTSGNWAVDNLAGTNMVQVQGVEYDGGGIGDGNATKVTAYPGGGAADRVTQTWYDWRNRPVGTKQGVEASESTSLNRPLSYAEYDNLGQVLYSEVYDGDTVSLTDGNSDGVPDRPSSGLLRAKTKLNYDEWGRTYKTETYSVDPSSGSVSSDALTSQVWFDIRGLTLKTSSPGGLVQKTAYDSLGRATTVYVTDGGGDAGYADADDVTGDTVLSQSEFTYDAAGNLTLTVTRERFHDASGTGGLGHPTSGPSVPTARVSYAATYYDLAGRVTDTVAVGTNAGSSWTRPGSVPGRSDTVLVSGVEYDAAGRVWTTTDPRALEARTTYDLAGRTVKTVENYVDGTVSDADDKTTEYAYGPAGMTSLTARLTGGGSQVTEWVYGVTTGGGSGVTSNDLIGATKWPDASTGAASSGQQETVLVNALGQPVVTTDRNGSTHTLTYDVLGRIVSDAVTTLGSGVDGAVRRVETAYDGQGNPYLITSYDAVSGGNIVTQVQRAYNGLGQLTAEYQSHSGAVNTGTTPKVQYAYSTLDSNNRSRLTSVTYPSGYVLAYNYSSGLNSDISRLSSLSDTSGTVESYDYLGLGTIVKRGHSQPGVDLTYVKQSGESTADAGDQYIGLDRFNRIADQRWRTGSADVERTQYGYDRDGNRTSRTNTVNSAYSEAYTYDGLNQLSTFNRNSGARTQAWDYDALGNWDSVTTNGGSPQTRTHNRQNEITGVSGSTSPTFDANGNLTTDETGLQYTYDAWNRLKVVKSSGGTTLKTYTYDGLNRRVAETASGTTTDLYYSAGWQVLEEAVGGTTKMLYVWSPVYVDALVLRDRDTDANGTLDERLWAVQDANFNVVALVNGSGTVVERYAYDSFGAVTVMNGSWTVLGSSAYGWVYLHQGGRLDATSGLYHFRMRDHSPTLGRWATMDPIGYLGQDNNVYRYLSSNPTRYTDAMGLTACEMFVKSALNLADDINALWIPDLVQRQLFVEVFASVFVPVPHRYILPQQSVPRILMLPLLPISGAAWLMDVFKPGAIRPSSYSGFCPQMTMGGQGVDVYRHLAFSISAVVSGTGSFSKIAEAKNCSELRASCGTDCVPSDRLFGLSTGQLDKIRSRCIENQAEVIGDILGRQAGRIISAYLRELPGYTNRAAVEAMLKKLLCGRSCRANADHCVNNGDRPGPGPANMHVVRV